VTPSQIETQLELSHEVDPLNLQISNLRKAVKKNQQILMSPRGGGVASDQQTPRDNNAIIFVPPQLGVQEEVKGSPFK
jgi:hypothetical protein